MKTRCCVCTEHQSSDFSLLSHALILSTYLLAHHLITYQFYFSLHEKPWFFSIFSLNPFWNLTGIFVIPEVQNCYKVNLCGLCWRSLHGGTQKDIVICFFFIVCFCVLSGFRVWWCFREGIFRMWWFLGVIFLSMIEFMLNILCCLRE